MTGRIMKGVGGFYTVLCEGERYTLRARGTLRHAKITPKVGDFAEFTPGKDGANGWLESVAERRNSLERPPVANIDIALLQAAAMNPLPDLMMLDRLIIMCHMTGVKTALIISKSDLNSEAAETIARQYRLCHMPVIQVSSESGQGLDEVRELVRNRTCAWAGQSGVGKSTIISKLFGIALETGDLSRKTERGRHTTRYVELLDMGDCMVFDTPGFSMLELPAINPMELMKGYPEFDGVAGCKFSPCAHISEPDCAFKCRQNELMSAERYERYKLIFEEAREKWRGRYD